MEVQENKYGFTTIVDILADGCRVEMKVRKAVVGKTNVLQAILDLLPVILEEYPTVGDAIDNWGAFTKEMADLKVLESVAAYQQITDALTEEEKTKSRLYRVIEASATGYIYTNDRIEKAEFYIKETKEQGLDLLARLKRIIAEE